jgi:hypothetical protein
VPLQLPQDQLSRAASAIAFLLLVLNSLLPVRVGIATMLTAPLPPRTFFRAFRVSGARVRRSSAECGRARSTPAGTAFCSLVSCVPGGRDLA